MGSPAIPRRPRLPAAGRGHLHRRPDCPGPTLGLPFGTTVGSWVVARPRPRPLARSAQGRQVGMRGRIGRWTTRKHAGSSGRPPHRYPELGGVSTLSHRNAGYSTPTGKRVLDFAVMHCSTTAARPAFLGCCACHCVAQSAFACLQPVVSSRAAPNHPTHPPPASYLQLPSFQYLI